LFAANMLGLADLADRVGVSEAIAIYIANLYARIE